RLRGARRRRRHPRCRRRRHPRARREARPRQRVRAGRRPAGPIDRLSAPTRRGRRHGRRRRRRAGRRRRARRGADRTTGERLLRRGDAPARLDGASARDRRRRPPQDLDRRGHEHLRLRAPGRAAVRTPHAQRVPAADEQDGRVVGEGLDGTGHVLPASLRRRGEDAERGARARVGGRHLVPAPTDLQEYERAVARERVRLRHLLRVRRRRCADVPSGLREPARRGQESGVEVRARGADVARPPGRRLARSLHGTREVSADLRPADPIAAVTHPDPYPYYADLTATRPIHRDEALGLWVACSAATVTAVLESPACLVRPPSEPVPRALVGSPAGSIFGRLVRMNDGAKHSALKPAVSAATVDLEKHVGEPARRWAEHLFKALKPADDPARVNEFAFTLSGYVLASMLGVAPDMLARIAAMVGDFARSIAPGATSEQLAPGSAAASELLAVFRGLLNARDTASPATLLGDLDREV